MERKTVGVIGLGYVGLPLVAALANVGYNVVGIDIDQKKIEHLQRTYEPSIYEPGLSETLKRYKEKIKFTTDYTYLMERCDTVMVTVGTPLKDDGTPNFDYINDVTTRIGKYLRKGQLIILKSTVVPGTTRSTILNLEKMSNLREGRDFYVVFCPERTIEGLALYELYTLPKIVGGINAESTDLAASVLKNLGGKVIKVSSPEVAEISKFADNLYRAMNIALANTIGCICEKLGVDAYDVVSAVNEAYERTHLYKPGLGADGPCLSKDAQILSYYSAEKGIDAKMIDVCVSENEKSTTRIASIASQYIKENSIEEPKISLIGLAFKGSPETDDIRGSPAVKIYNALQKEFDNVNLKCYDPIVKDFLSNTTSGTIGECILGSNIVMFLTNHPSLMGIDANSILENTDRPLLIIDCWHNVVGLDKITEQDVKVFRIGDGRL